MRNCRLIRNIKATISYYNLRVHKRKNEIIVLLSCPIGDVVYALSLIKEYKSRHMDKKIVLVAEKNTAPIVIAFHGYDEVRYYSKKKRVGEWIFTYLTASKFYASKGLKEDIINTVPWILHGVIGSTCIDRLKEDLSLPYDAQLQYPAVDSPLPSLVKDNGFTKTMIVNAFAHNDLNNELDLLFHEVINIAHKNNYIVYSNVVGEQPPIEGTIALRCSLDDFYHIANSVSLIISIRTGLMDWINNTKSKKIIIYPPSFNSDWSNFYSMKVWNQSSIMEFRYSDKNSIISAVKRIINESISGAAK